MKITAIILAAGSSKRMNQNKLIMNLHGERILDRVISACLNSDFHEVLLIVNKDTEQYVENDKVKIIVNADADEGVSTSIKLGLKHADEDSNGFAFIMGDQPFITDTTLNSLISEFNKNPGNIIVPKYKGTSGSPVIFPKFLKDEFNMISGDSGGKLIIHNHLNLVNYFNIDDEKQLKDIDTMEEYESEINTKLTCLIRGGGDLATGVATSLYKKGYHVIIAETDNPSCIRTEVSFATAVWDKTMTVEGIKAILIDTPSQRFKVWKDGNIPIISDKKLTSLNEIKPNVLIDAVIAKRNLGTDKDMAKLVIALGPGFIAPIDAHVVIETMRGETLGKHITLGSAIPDTRVPGPIEGYSTERVIHSAAEGKLIQYKSIGDFVEKGEVIAIVDEVEVFSKIKGTLRGLIKDGYYVSKGLKIADVDPRLDRSLAFKISDKAQALGNSVAEAIKTYYPKTE